MKSYCKRLIPIFLIMPCKVFVCCYFQFITFKRIWKFHLGEGILVLIPVFWSPTISHIFYTSNDIRVKSPNPEQNKVSALYVNINGYYLQMKTEVTYLKWLYSTKTHIKSFFFFNFMAVGPFSCCAVKSVAYRSLIWNITLHSLVCCHFNLQEKSLLFPMHSVHVAHFRSLSPVLVSATIRICLGQWKAAGEKWDISVPSHSSGRL